MKLFLVNLLVSSCLLFHTLFAWEIKRENGHVLLILFIQHRRKTHVVILKLVLLKKTLAIVLPSFAVLTPQRERDYLVTCQNVNKPELTTSNNNSS